MKDKQVYLVDQGAYWLGIQKLAQNAVVQVFAQVASFNWLEPYKIEAQYEDRGSGFFIDAEGHFVTNAHVVNEAKRIWINVPALGRQLLHAHIVGFCPDRDLALLRLDDEAIALMNNTLDGIFHFGLANSDAIQRTESVLSLGYPLGQYRLKSTTGVVSGLESVKGRTLIQITAPINPGNSGGPLLNIHGEVIGVAIASMESAQNIGYAIPINELKIVMSDLRTKKFVRTPILGVRFSYSGDEKAKFFGNPLPSGLYVSEVLRGSLFEKAGIQEGDMLYEFNGYAIDGYGEARVSWSLDTTTLNDLIGRVHEGQSVKMMVYRKGERLDIEFDFTLTLPLAIRQIYPAFESVEYEVVGGLVIMQLADNHIPLLINKSPDLLHYNLPENKIDPVLIITHLLAGSYAHQVRTCFPGDIISEVNDIKVGSFESFRKALAMSITTGFLTIKTERNVLVVFSLDRLLAEEQRLSQDFVYTISKTVQELYRATAKLSS